MRYKMKKAQLKTMFVVLLIALLILAVTSGLTVTLSNPTNNTWVTDSSNSVTFNFTGTGEIDPLTWCALYSNQT